LAGSGLELKKRDALRKLRASFFISWVQDFSHVCMEKTTTCISPSPSGKIVLMLFLADEFSLPVRSGGTKKITKWEEKSSVLGYYLYRH